MFSICRNNILNLNKSISQKVNKNITSFFSTSHTAKTNENFDSPDHGFEEYRIKRAPGDPTRREFTYFMLGGGRILYASVARLAVVRVNI